MSLHYTIDAGARRVYETASDLVSLTEILEARTRWLVNLNDNLGVTVLSDYRKASLDAKRLELRFLAAALAQRMRERQVYWAVAAPEPATFGQFRMLMSFLEAEGASPMCVFRELFPARQWLAAYLLPDRRNEEHG
ncbi:MAG: hypothetical protein M5U26_04415 [Planctomycetota bacterium]|nr:hypothetical protein [Planctomycetota bacterium]